MSNREDAFDRLEEKMNREYQKKKNEDRKKLKNPFKLWLAGLTAALTIAGSSAGISTVIDNSKSGNNNGNNIGGIESVIGGDVGLNLEHAADKVIDGISLNEVNAEITQLSELLKEVEGALPIAEEKDEENKIHLSNGAGYRDSLVEYTQIVENTISEIESRLAFYEKLAKEIESGSVSEESITEFYSFRIEKLEENAEKTEIEYVVESTDKNLENHVLAIKKAKELNGGGAGDIQKVKKDFTEDGKVNCTITFEDFEDMVETVESIADDATADNKETSVTLTYYDNDTKLTFDKKGELETLEKPDGVPHASVSLEINEHEVKGSETSTKKENPDTQNEKTNDEDKSHDDQPDPGPGPGPDKPDIGKEESGEEEGPVAPGETGEGQEPPKQEEASPQPGKEDVEAEQGNGEEAMPEDGGKGVIGEEENGRIPGDNGNEMPGAEEVGPIGENDSGVLDIDEETLAEALAEVRRIEEELGYSEPELGYSKPEEISVGF